MCGSEPCRHERDFSGTQADTLTSFIKSNAEFVKAKAEVARLTVAVFERDATLAKVAAIVADRMDLASARIRAALEPTQ